MTRQLAALIRRFPLIVRLPYLVFRRIQTRYTVGVAGVILDTQGRVLIVEHVFHPRFPWGLPGGWIGEDEDPAVAIVRELREELQLTATVTRVLHIAKPHANHIDLSFLCESTGPVGKLNHELLDFRWVDPSHLPEIKDFHRKSIEIAAEFCRRR